MTKRAAIAIVLTVLASTQKPTASTARYTVHDLGLAGGIESTATGINEAGSVAGWIVLSNHTTRAVRAGAGGAFELVPGLESIQAAAAGVNASGDLAGFVEVPYPAFSFHAVRYNTAAAAFEDLGTLGGASSFANGINDAGVMAGWSYNWAGTPRGFIAMPGSSLRDIGTFGGSSSFAAAVNNHDQVAGHAETSMGRYHAFRYTTAGGLVDLDQRPNFDSFVEGINEAGQVVGRFYDTGVLHAFRYTDGVGMQDLDGVGGRQSAASAINDHGDVVGYFMTSSGVHAFLYTDDAGFTDLNSLIDPGSGWVLTAAYGINNAGEIVGEGRYSGGLRSRAFKLTPQTADVTPPTITSASATPSILWPPNGNLISVGLSVSALDDVDPSVQCRIAQATSGGATSSEDIVVSGPLSVELRAARAGRSDGRQYSIVVTCADDAANEASIVLTVRAPHDMGQ